MAEQNPADVLSIVTQIVSEESGGAPFLGAWQPVI